MFIVDIDSIVKLNAPEFKQINLSKFSKVFQSFFKKAILMLRQTMNFL